MVSSFGVGWYRGHFRVLNRGVPLHIMEVSSFQVVVQLYFHLVSYFLHFLRMKNCSCTNKKSLLL